MSAGFDFNAVELNGEADASKIGENFEKLEELAITDAKATRLATTSQAGWMSAADKTKLNNIATGATKVTKVSQLTNDSNFISVETDPTVPSWAKAANKPTYNWNEITNKPTFVEQDNVIQFWKGTQAEYEALQTKYTNYMYLIYEEAD